MNWSQIFLETNGKIEYLSKVEPRAFPNELDLQCEKNKGIKIGTIILTKQLEGSTELAFRWGSVSDMLWDMMALSFPILHAQYIVCLIS